MSAPDRALAATEESGSGTCHGSEERGRRGHGQGLQLVLLGMPNTGKSTLYNRLTGGNAQIANWPGLTVELLRGPMAPDRNGTADDLVDLPGIHDLSGSCEDEAVVQRFMDNTPPDLVLLHPPQGGALPGAGTGGVSAALRGDHSAAGSPWSRPRLGAGELAGARTEVAGIPRLAAALPGGWPLAGREHGGHLSATDLRLLRVDRHH